MPADIAAFLDSYRDAFNRLDAEAIAGHFALPSMLAEREILVWTERAQIVANMQGLLGVYREGGFDRADYAVEALMPQGADVSVATLLWTVTRGDRRAPWRFHTAYTLRRFGSEWKIILCVAYEESAARTGAP